MKILLNLLSISVISIGVISPIIDKSIMQDATAKNAKIDYYEEYIEKIFPIQILRIIIFQFQP